MTENKPTTTEEIPAAPVNKQEEFLDEITCDLGLRQFLDQQIMEEQDAWGKDRTKSWYPSDLGKDLYFRYLKRKGYDSLPYTARELRKFEIGKLWEKRLHWVLDKMSEENPDVKAIDLTDNKRVEDNDLELRGYYDRMLLIRDLARDVWRVVVYEIKSVASTSFHYQKKEGSQPLNNIMQLMFYLERATKDFDIIKKNALEQYNIVPTEIIGVLSQVSKDDGSMWERTYELNQVVVDAIHKEINTLNECFVNDTPPPKPDIILIEDGKAKVNWEVSFSKLIHHWLGTNYAEVLAKADQLQRRHYYYRTKNPSKVGIIEKEIAAFNAEQKTKGV